MSSIISTAITLSSIWAWGANVTEVLCPEEIRTKQQLLSPTRGFEVNQDRSSDPQTIANVQLFDGIPSKGVELVPERENAEGVAIWELKTKLSHNLWISCDYLGTHIRLEKQLPDGLKKCTLKIKDKYKTPLGLNCHD